MNEFEIHRLCKKVITNTNPVSSLDASWNNLCAHSSDQISSLQGSTLFLHIHQPQWETPFPEPSVPPAFPSRMDCSKGCLEAFFLHFCLAEIFNLPHLPVSSPLVTTTSDSLSIRIFAPSFSHFLDTYLLNFHIFETYQQNAKHAENLSETCISSILPTAQ